MNAQIFGTPALEGQEVRVHPISNPLDWQRLAPLAVDPRQLEQQLIVSFQRRHPAAVAFDIMRTKLLQDAREKQWSQIGITAPTAGCGKATVAANLAISLAKHEKLRVGLIDLDLRHPRIAEIFDHDGQFGTDDFLRGECNVQDYLVRLGDNLAIGASPRPASFPAELLHGPRAAQTLTRLRGELGANIIIYNLPALLDSDDCLGLLPLMEASLLVVGAEQSKVADVDVCERELQERTQLLGVVLNKCRYPAESYLNFQN